MKALQVFIICVIAGSGVALGWILTICIGDFLERKVLKKEEIRIVDSYRKSREWYDGLTQEEKINLQDADDIQSLSLYAQLGLPIRFRCVVKNQDDQATESEEQASHQSNP